MFSIWWRSSWTLFCDSSMLFYKEMLSTLVRSFWTLVSCSIISFSRLLRSLPNSAFLLISICNFMSSSVPKVSSLISMASVAALAGIGEATSFCGVSTFGYTSFGLSWEVFMVAFASSFFFVVGLMCVDLTAAFFSTVLTCGFASTFLSNYLLIY